MKTIVSKQNLKHFEPEVIEVEDNEYSWSMPLFDQWEEALYLSAGITSRSLSDFVGNATTRHINQLKDDMSYFHKHRLYRYSREYTEEEVIDLAHRMREEEITLEQFHRAQTHILYFSVEQAHDIVSNCLEEEGKTLTIHNDQLYIGEEIVSKEQYLTLFDEGRTVVKIKTPDDLVQSIARCGISRLAEWGPFSDIKYLMRQGMRRDPWLVTLRRLVEEKKQKASSYREMVRDPELMPLPPVEVMEAIGKSLKPELDRKQHIEGIGTIQPKEYINKMQESRTHITTSSGRNAYERKVVQKVIDKMVSEEKDFCFVAADHTKYTGLMDVRVVNTLTDIRELPQEKYVLVTHKEQTPFNKKKKLIDSLVRSGKTVVYVERILKVPPVMHGIYVSSAVRPSRFYDITVMVLRRAMLSRDIAPAIRSKYIEGQWTEGKKYQLMTASYHRQVFESMCEEYRYHYRELTSGDEKWNAISGIINKEIVGNTPRDLLGVKEWHWSVPRQSVSRRDRDDGTHPVYDQGEYVELGEDYEEEEGW